MQKMVSVLLQSQQPALLNRKYSS